MWADMQWLTKSNNNSNPVTSGVSPSEMADWKRWSVAIRLEDQTNQLFLWQCPHLLSSSKEIDTRDIEYEIACGDHEQIAIITGTHLV